MPNMQWNYFQVGEEMHIVYLTEDINIDKRSSLQKDGTFTIRLNKIVVKTTELTRVESVQDVTALVLATEKILVCSGTGFSEKLSSVNCPGTHVWFFKLRKKMCETSSLENRRKIFFFDHLYEYNPFSERGKPISKFTNRTKFCPGILNTRRKKRCDDCHLEREKKKTDRESRQT